MSKTPDPKPGELSHDGAMAVLSRSTGHAELIGARCVMGQFEVVQSSDALVDASKVLRTFQSHTHDGEVTVVRTEYRTVIVSEQNPSEKAVVPMGFAMQILYHFSTDLQEDLEARMVFAKVYGVTHSWPYWREFMQSAFARMGLGINPAPLLQLKQAVVMAGFPEDTSDEQEAGKPR